MLRRLSVENYALIEKLEMELDPHLNIITGETGAGKSILLGALGLLLGAKNDGAAMKDAARNCVVEGIFDLSGRGMKSFFDENDLDYAPETHVTRMITPAGKSRAFINDIPVRSRNCANWHRLIDIHSQHQNLILSSEEFRTSALDTVAGKRRAARAVHGAVCPAFRTAAPTRSPAQAAADGRRARGVAAFPVRSLTAANLREGEQAATEAELAVLENADRIGEVLTTLRNAFSTPTKREFSPCSKTRKRPRTHPRTLPRRRGVRRAHPLGARRSRKTSTTPRPPTANGSTPTPNGWRASRRVSTPSMRSSRSTAPSPKPN